MNYTVSTSKHSVIKNQTPYTFHDDSAAKLFADWLGGHVYEKIEKEIFVRI
jgi:hypothetical protein